MERLGLSRRGFLRLAGVTTAFVAMPGSGLLVPEETIVVPVCVIHSLNLDDLANNARRVTWDKRTLTRSEFERYEKLAHVSVWWEPGNFALIEWPR